MKYKITYDFNINSLEDPHDLHIYDFGYLKAFIFNSDINVYRIIEIGSDHHLDKLMTYDDFITDATVKSQRATL